MEDKKEEPVAKGGLISVKSSAIDDLIKRSIERGRSAMSKNDNIKKN